MILPTGNPAPGGPGITARWTSSAKSGVGTAPTVSSRVWYTLSHGILDEIYYPRVDYACTRDFGLIVTDGHAYFSEEKRDTASTLSRVADGVPAFMLRNESRDGRYRIEKTVLTDPSRDVVLQRIRFVPLAGKLEDYRVHALLAPHLVNRGANNTGWVGPYKGREMLFASGSGNAMALVCSVPFRARSVGFVGTSDGWQDLMQHHMLTWNYDVAEDGNVALTGEIDLAACGGEFVLALGFGRRAEEAAHRVIASIGDGVDAALAAFTAGWRQWQGTLLPLDRPRSDGANTYRISTAVLRSHEASSFPGGIIASLSIPWGFHKGDEDLGGYHLVWPRDLVETAGALVAAGAVEDARRVLHWLETTQEPDGHWPQNCWLDGAPYWTGVQMDECAFPILLVDLLWREGGLSDQELRRYWRLVFGAARYLVHNGPVTGQDRWEEDGGYSPFTLAVEVAALLAAADLAEHSGQAAAAAYLRDTADQWNDQIESWTYVAGTPLAAQIGVAGYYVRIAPPETADAASPVDGFVPIKNRPPGEGVEQASTVISPDALALVRFGLRAADDPRIRDTVRVIDALLKVELPAGPCWRRYNGDGYGEHEDGRPFDGTGVGRPWPLLTGERAHYEIAAGNLAGAEALLRTLEACGSDGHLLPEQIWDGADIPARELHRGRPSGSAMPLVWAHSEHIKLLRSLREERVFDMPPQTRRRYQTEGVRARQASWRLNQKIRTVPAGKFLRIELTESAMVHWSHEEWRTSHDTPTVENEFGMHVADLDTADLRPGALILFTLYWTKAQRWQNEDYRLAVA